MYIFNRKNCILVELWFVFKTYYYFSTSINEKNILQGKGGAISPKVFCPKILAILGTHFVLGPISQDFLPKIFGDIAPPVIHIMSRRLKVIIFWSRCSTNKKGLLKSHFWVSIFKLGWNILLGTIFDIIIICLLIFLILQIKWKRNNLRTVTVSFLSRATP